MQLVREMYALTDQFPDAERFGLTQPMRRCAISIPSNIAEGAGRSSPKEFRHFPGIARGSLAELETQLLLSQDLGISTPAPDIDRMLQRVFHMLTGLMAKQNSTVEEPVAPYHDAEMPLQIPGPAPLVTRYASRSPVRGDNHRIPIPTPT